MRIKFIQDLLDFIKGKKEPLTLQYLSALKVQNGIKKTLKKIKLKAKSGAKIKVAFLVMYCTSCQNFCIFEKMLEDDLFDPYFIINPDIMRSNDNFKIQYEKSYNELSEKYGTSRVLNGYDFQYDKYIDYSNDFDLMTTNNPYDKMAFDYFKIGYWANKYVPIFYLSYFYMGRCYVSVQNLRFKNFSYFWKFFAENPFVVKLAKQHELIKGKNVVLSGYPKMDELSKAVIEKRERKRIILAPHHSIRNIDVFVGCFLLYYDLFLKLPDMFPEIDFVFRPHPMLKTTLEQDEFWGIEKTKKYFDEITAKKNVIYSTKGDYIDVFANSDAMIHDCGSYSAEYLYTNKPCAYMLKPNLNKKRTHTEFGASCINAHYILNNEKDIIDFIKNVVIDGNDYKKQERTAFANEFVMVNYPNAANIIFEDIKKSLIS